ncbi:MAG: radical SAM protein [Candidatus Alcyoniella australis]|nr:radical SAM protein [Candidatus Alcyoniella australis]
MTIKGKPTVLLIQPHSGFWERLRKANVVPLGLLSIASGLPDTFDIEIIDLRSDSNWQSKVREVLGRNCILVGITTNTGPMISSALAVAAMIREISDVPIVWGGVHPSLVPEQTAGSSLVDIVVRGEGEFIFSEVAQRLSEGASPAELNDICGLAFKQGDQITVTPDTPLIDPARIPTPAYQLLNIERYLPKYNGRRSLAYQSSRGCHRKCAYCYNSIVNKGRWRALGAERVLNELRDLHDQYRFDEIYFIDDNFFCNDQRSETIVEGLCKTPLTYMIQGVDIDSISRMDEPFLALLARSGLRRISIGIESGSPSMRQQLNKSESIAQIEAQITRLSKYQIQLYLSFIINLPGERLDDIRQTIRLIRKLHRLNPNVLSSPLYFYAPYPQTQLYYSSVQQGFQPPESLEQWGSVSFDMPNLSPAGDIDRRMLLGLSFSSYFIDDKILMYIDSRFLAALAALPADGRVSFQQIDVLGHARAFPA